MEKSIVEYLAGVLSRKPGKHLSMNSLKGHLSELSQKERKHIKQIGGLEKLVRKYHHSFLVCDDDVYIIEEQQEKDLTEDGSSETTKIASPDKISTVNLERTKDDPCTVCSDPIEVYAIGKCRHPICYRCSTKLRVLCEDKNCPVCRQTLDLVVFSKRLLPIDEHSTSDYIKDNKNGIAFETKSICEQKNALLRHVCPKCPNTSFDSFQSLESHAKAKHALYYCSICVRQCKIFTDERKMFTANELEKHIKQGDNAGSASGGHPLCEFCNYRYLDNDELLRHLRMHHCSCRICDQVNEEQKNFQFYADKNSLLDHQRDKHHPCEHPDCMELDQIPVFKDDIDLQSHNLQYHSGQKSKLEKRADHRLNLPLTYGKYVVKPQRITKTEFDAAGGINITGSVTWRIEKAYSFIERDDAPKQFEENVFFDLEACGLEPHEDLREIFKSGDRVSAYALPCTNPNAKSRWKAQKVDRMMGDGDVFGNSPTAVFDYMMGINGDGDAREFPPEGLLNEFPSLAGEGVPVKPSPALSGWSALAAAPFQIPKKMPTRQAVPTKPEYEVGYVHRNLSDKFGFIQRDRNEDRFDKNVYFNLEAYQSSFTLTQRHITDLRSDLSPGDKVCYILQKSPIGIPAKTQFRAEKVWKFSQNPELAPYDADGFRLVTGKAISKPKGPPLDKLPSADKLEELAEKYKKKVESQSVTLNRDNTAIGLNNSSNTVIIEDVMNSPSVRKENPSVKPAMNKLADPVIVQALLAPHTSAQERTNNYALYGLPISSTSSHQAYSATPPSSQESEAFMGYNLPHLTEGILPHASDSPFHSQLDQAISLTNGKKWTDEASSDNDSSSDDEYSSEEDDDTEDDTMANNPNHRLFFDALDACLNNKPIYKILKQQIKSEMQKQGVNDLSYLQFIELRKEDNTAHMLFHVPNPLVSGQEPVGYCKLNGFYPFNGSWSSELKTKKLATKVTKELYRIRGTSHYITVFKGRAEKARLTLHYRPSDKGLI